MEDALELFKLLKSAPQLWRKTVVTFADEDGVDEGGLTADAHASFWRDVLKEGAQLFECCEGGSTYLPRADADEEKLELVGRFLLKSILDNHPTGAGLCGFIFDFLCDTHNRRIFTPSHPCEALCALADFDPKLAEQWKGLLNADSELLATMERGQFDEEFGEESLTPFNAAETIVAGCRRKLLRDRESSLQALKRGFTYKSIDLTIQLSALQRSQLLLLVRGKFALTDVDLIGIFDWDVTATGLSQRVADFLKRFIQDCTDRQTRLRLLRWCTGQNALPADGLKQRVRLMPWDVTDMYLPQAHTCTSVIDLPAYSTYEVLRTKLNQALEETEAGGGFAIE